MNVSQLFDLRILMLLSRSEKKWNQLAYDRFKVLALAHASHMIGYAVTHKIAL